MSNIILFNKPFNVLSQFTDADSINKHSIDGNSIIKNSRQTLKDYLFTQDCRGFYPAGRLDKDSEGLLLLTNNGKIQSLIAEPKFKLPKTYWAQVEGMPTQDQLAKLRKGIILKDGLTRPAKVDIIETPKNVWDRHPPIRFRKNDITTWLSITITQGKNRQVRRMTAAINCPTLRLIRYSIGDWSVSDIKLGEYVFSDYS